MKIDLRLWAGTAALAALSLLAAFFVTFNMVFSDVFGVRQRIESYVFAGVVFVVLGLAAGLLGPGRVRRWTWVLGAPSVAVLALYTLSERQNALIHLGFAVLVPLASYGGARLGSRLRAKRPPASGARS